MITWMRSVELDEFCDIFSHKRVRGTALLRLNEKMLEELGITSAFAREQILGEIEVLRVIML